MVPHIGGFSESKVHDKHRNPTMAGNTSGDIHLFVHLVSDVLIGVRVAIASDTMTACTWLETKGVAVHDTRHARR